MLSSNNAESAIASLAASNANCEALEAILELDSTKLGIDPAIVMGKLCTTLIPECPLRRAFQVLGIPKPKGEMQPSPVTTMRSFIGQD